MALSLGVSAGTKIAVGQDSLLIRAIVNPELFVIQINGGSAIEITDQKPVLVLPDVRVHIGKGNNTGARLAFDAPKHIAIMRESKS